MLKHFARCLVFGFIATFSFLLVGCAPSREVRHLKQGFDALEAGNPSAALAKGDEFLRLYPKSTGLAEAHYLRGRAYEARVAYSSADARMNLQAARLAYIDALGAKPNQAVDTYIRTSLANVAFFQDDFSTALALWQYVLPRLDDRQTRAWTLYRIGLCQQRMGRFGDADATFDRVVRNFPGTLQASRSAEVRGARGFFVQVGAFAVASSADRMSDDLVRRGARVVRAKDPRGLHLVQLGPFQSYAAAAAERNRWAAFYPDARILP
jgi:tetratricopeptide (TPR) repeat protein